MSADQARQSMTGAGMLAWMVQTLLELLEVSKAGDCAEVTPTVEQILKRKPISFDQFLSESADAFRPATGGVAGAA